MNPENQIDKRMLEWIIAHQIKPLTLTDALADMEKLKIAFHNNKINALTRYGLKFCDFFTLQNRLAVRGKMNLNFYDFLKQWDEYKNKKYIKTIFDVENLKQIKDINGNRDVKVKYGVYNVCINSVHVFKPSIALSIYKEFSPKCILDCCAGWCSRALAAHIFGCRYIGIDINDELAISYERINQLFGVKNHLIILDSLKINYSEFVYDMVFTSPPYYNIERYEHNAVYKTKDDWATDFYIPLFMKVFRYLQPGDHMVLNMNNEMYKTIFSDIFGEADRIIPLEKKARPNISKPDAKKYNENIYVWRKPISVLLE